MMVVRHSAMIDIGHRIGSPIVVIAREERRVIVVSGFLGVQHRRRVQVADHQGCYRDQEKNRSWHDTSVNIGAAARQSGFTQSDEEHFQPLAQSPSMAWQSFLGKIDPRRKLPSTRAAALLPTASSRA